MRSSIGGKSPDQTVDEQMVKALVQATFNAAASHFDAAPLFFWDQLGRRTVQLAGVSPGNSVLDVCCGAGGSALPAAAAVGPEGQVLGVDLADGLLDLAREKAARRGLDNVRFVVGDMEHLEVADQSVDAVICVLGIYFAQSIPTALAGLWRALRPGGTLLVTTWGERALEPANSLYLEAVAEENSRFDVRGQTVSWARINSRSRLTQAFQDGGLPAPEVTEEVVTHPVTADGFWQVVLGSGYRIMLEALGQAAAERIHHGFTTRMQAQGVRRLSADVLYARATRAPSTV